MRFRPRFSVRTLAVFVTLVCAYFGAWEATKRYGVPDPDWPCFPPPDYKHEKIVSYADCPTPFILGRDEFYIDSGEHLHFARRYYLWLFGPEFKLPYESEGWSDEGYFRGDGTPTSPRPS